MGVPAWRHTGLQLPGKPTDNALAESFNGKVRAKCLNTAWFLSLDDARRKRETWRRDRGPVHHRGQGHDAEGGRPECSPSSGIKLGPKQRFIGPPVDPARFQPIVIIVGAAVSISPVTEDRYDRARFALARHLVG